MARKKYEATRTIRNIGPTQVAEGPNYTGLIQATTARSEAMSSLIGGMKTFTEEKFLADASKRAAKTALDNDPLQVVMATQDSMKTEDKLAASISMKQLQNNVIRSYDAKVKKQAIESLKNSDNSTMFSNKITNLLSEEIDSIREAGFDSPIFELNVRDNLSEYITKNISSYEQANIEKQQSELIFETNQGLDAQFLLDFQNDDIKLTNSVAYMMDNPEVFYNDQTIKEQTDKLRGLLYTNKLKIIQSNKNMSSEEVKAYKNYWKTVKQYAEKEGNTGHLVTAMAALETLDDAGSGLITLTESLALYDEGIGQAGDDNPAGAVIKNINEGFTITEIIEAFTKNLSAKDKAKNAKKLNEFYNKYVEDQLFYDSQKDGYQLAINEFGLHSDESLMYIKRNKAKTGRYDTKANINRVIATSKAITNPKEQFIYFKNYFNQFNRIPGTSTESVAESLFKQMDGLPEEDKELFFKMAYLNTYSETTVASILSGAENLKADKDFAKTITDTYKETIAAEIDKKNTGMSVKTRAMYISLGLQNIAGKVSSGSTNLAPSGVDVVPIVIDEIFGIERNANDDVIHGYDKGDDNNYFDINKNKTNGITLNKMSEIMQEKNSNNIKYFLRIETTDAEGNVEYVPLDELPPGFNRTTIEPVFAKPFDRFPTMTKVFKKSGIDFTEDEIKNLMITNSENNPDLFYLAGTPSANQNKDAIVMVDGKKVLFDAYGFVKNYTNYEKYIETIKAERQEADARYSSKIQEESLFEGLPGLEDFKVYISGRYKGKDEIRTTDIELPTFADYLEMDNR
tara:strand:+ start:4301 stop:6694 length:2394 start_codon:yes stop_codon:yes gene_type:complete